MSSPNLIDFTVTQVYNPAAGRRKLGIDIDEINTGIANAILIATNTSKQVGPAGPRGLTGIPGLTGASGSTTSIVAQEMISAFAPVLITGFLAHSNDPSGSFGRVLGLANWSIPNGFTGNVTAFGLIANPGWAWTPGASIFLNGASLSQAAPNSGFVQRIGMAKNPTAIFVELGEPVLI